MTDSPALLRQHALQIWNAGVRAVRSEDLTRQNVLWTPEGLRVADVPVPLRDGARIEIIGAGKAGTGMAAGLLSGLESDTSRLARHAVGGWINVPADCVRSLDPIHVHPARPAGVNEPTEAGVAGTGEILSRVARLAADDLCIALISGGGSALLPAPAPPVTLADKQQITRFLAAQGATIQELNTVRANLSLVKGGNLARRCSAGTLITLIISDVIGDPLEWIASGPTILTDAQPEAAKQILSRYDPHRRHIPESAFDLLNKQHTQPSRSRPQSAARIVNRIIGSNRIALEAAAETARTLGFRIVDLGSENSGEADQHGRRLLAHLQTLRAESQVPVCLLAGGETTVQLNSDAEIHGQPGKGGRNQEVVLAAIDQLSNADGWTGLCLLSGGTDGEDGPTDAAGAIAEAEVVAAAVQQNLNPTTFLSRHDSWSFFDSVNGLIRTGPTHTNVMDLAVGIAWPAKP